MMVLEGKKVNFLRSMKFQIDIKYESRLVDRRKARMNSIMRDLENILTSEEIKARQRSKDRNVKEGDKNTTYFQAIANQRARKERINFLESDEGLLEDNQSMLDHVIDFYKKLFGLEKNLGVKLSEDFWEEGDKVTMHENAFF